MANSNSEETIVVQDGNDFLTGMIAAGCQQRGLDTNAVLAMCNGRNGNGFDLNGLIGLIVVAGLFGNGNGLFGNGNNREGERMIMDAVQRNGIDISQLASTLNCSVGQIQNAVQLVANQICALEGQVGMTGQQIINSLQQGNMALTQQLCNCCCDIKSAICNQTNVLQNDINFVNRSVERGFADLGYATRDQTCAIEKAIAASTEAVLAGQRAAEMREMQREIAERDRRIAEQAVIINNAQQSAMITQTIGQAVAPINAALGRLSAELAEVQCRLPETKVISCPDNYVKVSTGLNVPLQVSPACGFAGGWNWFSNPFNNNGGWG